MSRSLAPGALGACLALAFSASLTDAQVTPSAGIPSFNGRHGAITLLPSDIPPPITILPQQAADGTRTAFTLPIAPDPLRSAVAISGLYQQAGSYTLQGTSLTFTQPPPYGSSPYVVQGALPSTLTGGSSSGGISGAPQVFPFTGDGTTTSFSLPATPQTLDRYQVTISGVVQTRSSCTLSTTALVCVQPPPLNTAIEVQDGP